MIDGDPACDFEAFKVAENGQGSVDDMSCPRLF